LGRVKKRANHMKGSPFTGNGKKEGPREIPWRRGEARGGHAVEKKGT